MSIKVVHSGSGVIKVNVDSTPAISVKSPEVGVISVNPNVQGTAIGATGAQGPTGATGAGVPTGGEPNELLKKSTNGNYQTEWGFADRVYIEVRFTEAVSKGDPVYMTGYSQGQGVEVERAKANDASKMPAIGLASADYSINTKGYVACIGELEDVDTSLLTEAAVVYVGATGGLTTTKPTGSTNLIQNVGKVGRSNQNNGEITVMAIGRSNDVPNIEHNKVWIGNSSGVASPRTLDHNLITDFDNGVETNSAVAANTAKVSNVTTDLSVSVTLDDVTVASSDGTDAVLPEARSSGAGIMTAEMHDKLDGIEDNADVTDSTNVNSALSSLTDIGTPADDDKVLIQDTSDSDTIKYVDWSDIGGGSGTVDVEDGVTPLAGEVAYYHDADTITSDRDFTWNEAGDYLDVIRVRPGEVQVNGKTTSTTAGTFLYGSRIGKGMGGSASVTAGKIYYLGASGWAETNANAESTASGLIAVATTNASAGEMVLTGGVVMASSAISFSVGAATGDPVYLDTSNATITDTPPSGTGDIVRHVGYILKTSGVIYLDPDKSFIEL